MTPFNRGSKEGLKKDLPKATQLVVNKTKKVLFQNAASSCSKHIYINKVAHLELRLNIQLTLA